MYAGDFSQEEVQNYDKNKLFFVILYCHDLRDSVFGVILQKKEAAEIFCDLFCLMCLFLRNEFL